MLAPLDIANCDVFLEPKLSASAGRPLRAARLTSTSRSTIRRGKPGGWRMNISESSLLIWRMRQNNRNVVVEGGG